MANKTMDSAREFETQAKELLERVKRMQNDLGAALQSVKRAESELIDKEKRAEKERMEKERETPRGPHQRGRPCLPRRRRQGGGAASPGREQERSK